MPSTPKPFPLTLALLSAATTSLALLAALFNIRWGAAPDITQPDALTLAAPYVAFSLTLTTMILWPALAFARKNPIFPLLDLPALLTAALPSTALACFTSALSASDVLNLAATQVALALLSAGTISLGLHRPALRPLAAALLATLTLILPLLAYLLAEFFPAANLSLSFAPLLTAARTSPWPTIATYATLGILLAFFNAWGAPPAPPPAQPRVTGTTGST